MNWKRTTVLVAVFSLLASCSNGEAAGDSSGRSDGSTNHNSQHDAGDVFHADSGVENDGEVQYHDGGLSDAGCVSFGTEICGDDIDNNCNGQVNEGCVCVPVQDGVEVCDGLDDDCDGVIDNNCVQAVLVYRIGDSQTTAAWPDVTDLSGSGNHGVATGDASLVCGEGSHIGGANPENCSVLFQGSGHIRVPNHVTLDGFAQVTWMAWVYVADNSPVRTVFAKAGSYMLKRNSSVSHHVFNYANAVSAWASEFSSQRTLSVDYWHFVAIAYDGYEFVFYLDGIETHRLSSYGNMNRSSNDLFIGAEGLSGNGFAGMIDEIVILPFYMSPDWLWRYYSQYTR